MNPNLIIDGLSNSFITVKKNETVRITCSKINGYKNGTLAAFVSTKEAKAVKCLSYSVPNTTDEFYCNKKLFEYTLIERSYSNYQLVCRFVENAEQINKILFRLCKYIHHTVVHIN